MLLLRYSEDMQDMVTHTQNGNINLYNTSMFICMPKINFIINFFLEILHFKESFNFIGIQHLTNKYRLIILLDMMVKYQ